LLVSGWAFARDDLAAGGLLRRADGAILAGLLIRHCARMEGSPGAGLTVLAVGDAPGKAAGKKEAFQFVRHATRDARTLVCLGDWMDPRYAHYSHGESGGYRSFRFEDQKGRLVVEGDVDPPRGSRLWDSLGLEAALGKAAQEMLNGRKSWELSWGESGRGPAGYMHIRSKAWSAGALKAEEVRLVCGPASGLERFEVADVLFLQTAEVERNG